MKNNFENFPSLDHLLESELRDDLPFEISDGIMAHIESSIEIFLDFVPEETAQPPTWMINPFICDLDSMDDDDDDELINQLIDLKSNALLHEEFNVRSRNDFWCSQRIDYSDLDS